MHFGLFSLHAKPRQFGGVGLMIEHPGVELCMTPASEWSAAGPLSTRCWNSLAASPRAFPPPISRQALNTFSSSTPSPEHVGLGRTQLGLATARILAEASGLRENIVELAGRWAAVYAQPWVYTVSSRAAFW